ASGDGCARKPKTAETGSLGAGGGLREAADLAETVVEGVVDLGEPPGAGSGDGAPWAPGRAILLDPLGTAEAPFVEIGSRVAQEYGGDDVEDYVRGTHLDGQHDPGDRVGFPGHVHLPRIDVPRLLHALQLAVPGEPGITRSVGDGED